MKGRSLNGRSRAERRWNRTGKPARAVDRNGLTGLALKPRNASPTMANWGREAALRARFGKVVWSCGTNGCTSPDSNFFSEIEHPRLLPVVQWHIDAGLTHPIITVKVRLEVLPARCWSTQTRHRH